MKGDNAVLNYFLRLKTMAIEIVLWAEKEFRGKSGPEKKKAVIKKLTEMILRMSLPWYISWAQGIVAPLLINYLVDLACEKLNFLSNWNFENIELDQTQLNELASVLAAPVNLVADTRGQSFEDKLNDLYHRYAITDPFSTVSASEEAVDSTAVELPRTGNVNNQLSKNLARREITCKCGCGFDIVDFKLVETFQALRDYVNKSIYITSGCRCPEHNKKVGGVGESAHVEGKALDMYINGLSSRQFGELVKKAHGEGKLPYLKYCYLISNSTSIHIGVDEKERKSIWGW
jgi:uncharacterized protein YcbK (DUF882 family)